MDRLVLNHTAGKESSGVIKHGIVIQRNTATVIVYLFGYIFLSFSPLSVGSIGILHQKCYRTFGTL